MINLPNTAKVHKIIPKNSFYNHLNLSSKLKKSFVSDIENIYLEYDLTQKSLNLSPNSEGEEILILFIKLKGKDLNFKILEEIARQIPHQLIFYLENSIQCQLAIYKGKLYRSEWKDQKDLVLEAKGISLKEIWEEMIGQIAISREMNPVLKKLSIEEQLKRQDRINHLQKQIEKKEKAVWKEIQPKKKFKLHTELNKLRKELEELING